MSNTEVAPAEVECGGSPHSGVEVIAPREVPLGGPRAMLVRRTLPTRARTMIGAWCFADHYGGETGSGKAGSGDGESARPGMRVLPHPHTGLQTVSWLFGGEIEHRDSAGVHTMVRPGELNLMSAGHGISHSEVAISGSRVSAPAELHGVQLWLALPDAARDDPPGFAFHAPAAVALPGAGGGAEGTAKVFLGTLAGDVSPVRTATPLLGGELCLEPGADVTLAVAPAFEHGVLVDTGTPIVGDVTLRRGELGYTGPGTAELRLRNPGSSRARMLLLGGEPFGEQIVMWWNFVGRSHEEIVAFREAWERGDRRFGEVGGWDRTDRIPAPPLPKNVRLRPRGR